MAIFHKMLVAYRITESLRGGCIYNQHPMMFVIFYFVYYYFSILTITFYQDQQSM